MLSERDRRTLDGIERDLVATSPGLARRLRRPLARRVWALPVGAAAAGVLLAIALVALGLAGDAFVLLVLLAWPLAQRLLHRRRSLGRVWSRSRRDRPDGRGTAAAGV